MEPDTRTLAVDEPTRNKRIILIGGRAITVNAAALDVAGNVVRPDLMPSWLGRPNRRERRKRARRAASLRW